MKSEPKIHDLQKLAQSYLNRELGVNPEYQRGTVWTPSQKQALIDSLLRGYHLPLFYVHLKETANTFTGGTNTSVWLVDGQQRLDAIARFLRNEFALADPSKESPGSVIPTILQTPCSWHGKRFDELGQADKELLLSRKLQVIEMREESPNEVRDLFIRLQAGTPLTAQEKRDAWPGNFTVFVIQHAGKPGHPASNPKPFFQLVPRGRTLNIDDGNHYVDGLADTRKFFAGLAMTIMVRERSGEDFVDLKGKTINEFYKENLDIQSGDPAGKRVVRTLDIIPDLPGFADLTAQKPMSFQMAFHFAVIVDALLCGNYVPIWRDDVIKAFIKFQTDVAQARLHYRKTGEALPHHEKFIALLGGSGSDTADIIRRRHNFFMEKMYASMRIKPKDDQRLFDSLEKELIWNRDGRKCQNPECGRQVAFREAHVHHVTEHVAGGATVIGNGVAVCCDCHTDRKKMQELAAIFQAYLQQAASVGRPAVTA